MRSITDIFRWAAPLACVAVGLYLLSQAFGAHADYLAYMALGDPSGAELPEIEMWFFIGAGVLLLLIGAFLGGLFCGRR